MSAGARYRAQQEAAEEARRLNKEPRTKAARSPTPRPSPGGPGRSGGSAGRGGGGRAGDSRPLLPRQRGQSGAPEYRNYQAIILAEFIAAELLVAATPIATRKNQPGLSPYVPRDLTKLVAIGLVYFLLQLAATTGGGAGRFGAWGGFLILIAVGLNEAASVSQVLDLFSGVKTKVGALAANVASGNISVT
jgi:hypothetical protein